MQHRQCEYILDEVPVGEMVGFKQFIMVLTLQHHANFCRRIMQTLTGYPFRLLILAKNPGDTPCDERRRECQALLDTPDTKLHITALKIKRLFAADLAKAAESGCLTGALFVTLRLVTTTWRMEVQ